MSYSPWCRKESDTSEQLTLWGIKIPQAKPHSVAKKKKRKKGFLIYFLAGFCLGFLHVQVQCLDVVYNHTMPSVYVHDMH